MATQIVSGSLESSDCLIKVRSADKRTIELDTVVREGFYDHIHALIEETADEMGVTKVHISCKDQGALDYTIKARLKVALRKFKEADHG